MKLADTHVRLHDFRNAEDIIGLFRDSSVTEFEVEKAKLINFLILVERFAAGNANLSTCVPSKLIKLTVTERQRQKYEEEAQLARMVEEEEKYPLRESHSHYRHILAFDECYEIKNDQSDSDNPGSAPEKRIKIFPAVVNCIKQGQLENDVNVDIFLPQVFEPIDTKRTIKQFLENFENLKNRGVLEATAKRCQAAFEWLITLDTFKLNQTVGCTMGEIAEEFEILEHKRNSEVNQVQNPRKFGLDDIGLAIQFGLETKHFYELGIATQKFVLSKVS